MKKINLKGISEILSEKELKKVIGGGSGYGCPEPGCFLITCDSDGSTYYVACPTTIFCDGGIGCVSPC